MPLEGRLSELETQFNSFKVPQPSIAAARCLLEATEPNASQGGWVIATVAG